MYDAMNNDVDVEEIAGMCVKRVLQQYHASEPIITIVVGNRCCGIDFALLWWIITTAMGYHAYCGGLLCLLWWYHHM